MPSVTDFKLTDLLSSAGATIGIVIAGTIFLQFLSSRYNDLISRYRGLIGELRGEKPSPERQGPLNAQIRMYRSRLSLMNWATGAGIVALLGFLGSLICGGLSIIFADFPLARTAGIFLLFFGFLAMGSALMLVLREGMIGRGEIHDEKADLHS